jgi:hypothetical protein
MKQLFTFLIFLVTFSAHAQVKVDAGLLAGIGGRNGQEPFALNAHQSNAAIGLHLNVRFWDIVFLTGRTEYQRRHYQNGNLFGPLSPNSNVRTKRDAIVYQYGLGLQWKGLYASAGPTFTDDLSEKEYTNTYICDCIFPPTLPTPSSSDPYSVAEGFSARGFFVNIGYTRALSQRAQVVFEFNYMRERARFNSLYVDPFEAAGLRLGLQRKIFSSK